MSRRLAVAIAAVLAALIFTPAPARADCTCRYNGGTTDVGDTVCMKTPNGARLARCDMALNNPSWTFLDAPCPSANVSPAPKKHDHAKHPHERRPAIAQTPQ